MKCRSSTQEKRRKLHVNSPLTTRPCFHYSSASGFHLGFSFAWVCLLPSQIYILLFPDSANSSPAKHNRLLARLFCYHRPCSRKPHSSSGTGAADQHLLPSSLLSSNHTLEEEAQMVKGNHNTGCSLSYADILSVYQALLFLFLKQFLFWICGNKQQRTE